MPNKNRIEIISGVGDFPCLYAAVKAKADAIYFGVKGLNMRDFGKNFTIKELPLVVEYCHKNKVKAYLALNTIVYDKEQSLVKRILNVSKKAKIDAVICSDFLIFQESHRLKIPIHISTQMSVSNSSACNFLVKCGAKRIVLARELSLKQIKEIRKKTKIELEIFVHGSLCISVSGRCFMSLYFHDKSANRGKCTNPCRRVWYLEGEEQGNKAEIYGNRIISSKDLCTIPFFEKLVQLNPTGFKIEGRNKGPDYIYLTTKVYKEALQLAQNNKLTKNAKAKLEKQLSTVFNRGFISGFYLREPDHTGIQPKKQSERTSKLVCIGRVRKYFAKPGVAEINADLNFEVGKEIVVQGSITYFRQKLESVEFERNKVSTVKRGQDVGIKVNEQVRKGDLIYILDS
ncbi:MAG: protease [Candidatus Diapherotrites archaeon CG08_land_8_20_14_0_20_30_16]|nr:MAG: protease [Candidatus Diapherotrites archaeon CG08_land_8_20_14_0_20_30_16]